MTQGRLPARALVRSVLGDSVKMDENTPQEERQGWAKGCEGILTGLSYGTRVGDSIMFPLISAPDINNSLLDLQDMLLTKDLSLHNPDVHQACILHYTERAVRLRLGSTPELLSDERLLAMYEQGKPKDTTSRFSFVSPFAGSPTAGKDKIQLEVEKSELADTKDKPKDEKANAETIRKDIISRVRKCLSGGDDVMGTLYAVIRHKKELAGLADPETAELLLAEMQEAIKNTHTTSPAWRKVVAGRKDFLDGAMDCKYTVLTVANRILDYFRFLRFILNDYLNVQMEGER